MKRSTRRTISGFGCVEIIKQFIIAAMRRRRLARLYAGKETTVSPIPSRTLAARVAARLRAAALLALLLAQIPPALAGGPALARHAPGALARPARPALAAAGVTATQTDLLLVDVNGNR